MPRPNRSAERRLEFIPLLARAFADLGYRRTTTAELAARCDVRENVLYRLWPDKRAMFIAALDHVYDQSESTWSALLEAYKGDASGAEVILEYESTHQGEFGLYRLVFAGLSETDDPEIAAALKRAYSRFHRFIQAHIKTHQVGRDPAACALDPKRAAWAMIGLGTVANIGRELGLLSAQARRSLVRDGGRTLLG